MTSYTSSHVGGVRVCGAHKMRISIAEGKQDVLRTASTVNPGLSLPWARTGLASSVGAVRTHESRAHSRLAAA